MDDIANFFYIIYERFTRNLRGSLEGMSPEKWIRIVIIVGAYMLLRPYLIKLGGKVQMKQHEKEAAAAEAEAEWNPNVQNRQQLVVVVVQKHHYWHSWLVGAAAVVGSVVVVVKKRLHWHSWLVGIVLVVVVVLLVRKGTPVVLGCRI